MILVVGAGLVGLSIAQELARRGAEVRVLDAAEPGAAASWAAAGMLAPHTEDLPSAALRAFCEASLSLYPAFVERLREDSGIDPRLRLDGIVHIARSVGEAERLRAHVSALSADGIAARLLSSAETVTLEPIASGAAFGSALMEGEGHVDNRRLGRALLAACRRRGVAVDADCGPVALEADARRVRGVRTKSGFHAADVVLNATGAWSGALEGVPEAARVPVHPVKGQMVALAMPRGLVRRPVWFSDGYVVPRDDGRLLIGATVEDVGFDVRVTAEGVHALLDAALRAFPLLRDLAVIETWAGVRPGSADGLPYIGFAGIDGYAVAAGHYRNGVLMAPATAMLVADLIEGRTPACDPAPFAALRSIVSPSAADRTA